jgi:hypothetical protein
LLRTSRPSTTTAAAVSSQVDSMARIVGMVMDVLRDAESAPLSS